MGESALLAAMIAWSREGFVGHSSFVLICPDVQVAMRAYCGRAVSR